MSATLHRSLLDTVDNPFTEGDQVVTIEDTDDDSHLRRRLDTRRTIASLAADVAKPRDIATAVAARHVAGSLTLVIVNTVKTAVAVYRALLKIGPAADVTLLHSRFRPIERGAIMAEVLAPPNTSGRIVVATQVIEAGADLDAATLISEVAPWPSMVQRAGRLNRAGLRDAATLWWLPAPKQTAPYDADVIAQSEHALRALEGESVTSRELLAAGPPEKPASVRVLRRIDFDSLFDTTPDLTGNDLDIAPYVRDTADELDVQVFWGNWDRTPPDAMRAPAHDYRCRAPITAVRELIKRARVWRFDQVAASWQPVGAIRPGDVLAVAARDGGYRPDIGFDPASLAPVITLDVPADAQAREDAFADDARSVGSSRWITLDQHLCETEAEAKKLVMTLRLTEDEKADVVLAARLHDCGKAHPAWQQAIRTTATDDLPVPDSGLPYAKSPNGRSRLRFDKGVTNFRHELAGLTMLDGPLQSLLNTARDRDLVRYLVLAHHGRVRVQARNPTNDTSGRLLGLLDGESAELPDILGVAGVTYAPVLAAFLGNGIGASWSDTVDGLLERFGGARLAFLETIVRVADWRASALHDVTNEVRS